MNLNILPAGDSPAPVPCCWFPAVWQAFLWRNHGLVPEETLAEILECSPETVREELERLGASSMAPADPDWLEKGYLTIIRNNWHLLDYGQLLRLLNWTPERLALALKEEDFLFCKLGGSKPACPPVRYVPLTDREKLLTEQIRKDLEKFFTQEDAFRCEKAFAFSNFSGPVTEHSRKRDLSFEFIHSYAASCGDIFLNAETADPVPENLLKHYASMGIRGVWMHAVMYLLSPIPGAESFSEGWEKRRKNLKRLAERCAEYGIRIYLYFNEPRGMTEEFYRVKPDWLGIRGSAGLTTCISRTEEPLQWLEESFRALFREIPELGGVFLITMSENATHCNNRHEKQKCPYCKDVPAEVFPAKILCAAERGVHASAPDARVIAFDWAWSAGPSDSNAALFKKKVIDLLPESVCIMTVSEWGKLLNVGGVPSKVIDYSISQTGPSEESAEVLRYAKSKGHATAAKIQVNNSWELSAVPSIPVPYLIREHLEKLNRLSVDGLMLSWTLGGFPGGNLELLDHSPEELAARDFSAANAEIVCEAWKCFSGAFREFPFHVNTVYTAPMNYGPVCPLYLTPTEKCASMIGYPYDHLNAWRAVYPEEIFEDQFRKIAEGWNEGLEKLARILPSERERIPYGNLVRIAEASYCHLRSTWNQIRFVRARNRSDKEIMRSAAEDEIALAVRLHRIIRQDSRIGFEASNHYYYTLNDLKEKVINCRFVLRELAR